MDFQSLYSSKLISVNEALLHINSGDEIVSGLAAAEPKEFLSALHTIAGRVKNITVITCLPFSDYEYFMNPIYKDTFRMEGWFYNGSMRKSHNQGNISFIPNNLHFSSTKRLAYSTPNIFVANCSPMDEHGYVSLGISTVYEKDMVEAADLVILEVNPNVPRTFGDTTVYVGDVDYLIEVDYKLPCLPSSEPNDKDIAIGKLIAEYVEDGSTIQLGIGGIPNAVAQALLDKKDLGIHTEMFTDGMIDLINNGCISNKHKGIHNGKTIATFALGSQKLYDFIDNNPSVEILKGTYVNDPYVIGKNNNMVSINTAIEIDLTGQVCSESIGHKQFSGTGGQSDTAIGAQNSKNGKSFIALYSTTKVRVKGSDEKVTKSKIVTALALGSTVSLSRNDVDFVVTEYGVAALRGTSIKERVKRLIAIAHPDFRDELQAEAESLMIW